MRTLERLDVEALEMLLTQLNEVERQGDGTGIAGSTGGPCAGFWFRRFTPRNLRKGQQNLGTARSQSATRTGSAQTVVVHDSAFHCNRRSFIGVPVEKYEGEVARRNGETKVVHGTFRAAGLNKCEQFAAKGEQYPDGMCKHCTALERNRGFIDWLRKDMRHNEDPEAAEADPRCNHGVFTASEGENRLYAVGVQNRAAVDHAKRLEHQLQAERDRPVDCIKALKKGCEKGSVEEICAKLLEAKEKNEIKPSHKKLIIMIGDQIQNISRKPKGFRHSDEAKALASALKIKYGQNCSAWLAANTLGPSARTIRRFLPSARHQHGYADTLAVVLGAKEMYQTKMKNLNLEAGSVACYLAEDETKIRAEASYDEKTDTIVGFCGKRGCAKGEHECTLDGHCHIGAGGAEGYKRIVDAMTNGMIGEYGRCIMLCPLHRDLPALVVLVAPTCNRFTADGYVSPQWKAVSKICNDVLGSVLGTVIGHASDGDPRRRNIQQHTMQWLRVMAEMTPRAASSGRPTTKAAATRFVTQSVANSARRTTKAGVQRFYVPGCAA